MPISIKVFNQQQLSNRNIETASELATYTPSLSANSNYGSQNTTFALRGFVQDQGTQPSVGTYFADVVAPRGGTNNVPVGDGANAGSFFDLSNIQILKGPQGTLFGENTTGGAVLFVPQKPTSNLDGYIETGYGNYDMKSVQGVVNIPISDKIRLRIGVDHENRDGYVKNVSGIGPSKLNDLEYTAVRASLVVDVTEDIENYSIFSYTNSHENGDVQKLAGCNPDPATSGLFGSVACGQLQRYAGAGFYTVESALGDQYQALNTWQAINTTTWKATDEITIKNIISYAQLKDDLSTALFGTDFDAHSFIPFLFPKGTPFNFSYVQPPAGGDTAHESTFTEELQVQGTALNNRLTYQGGVYLELADPLGVSGQESPVLADCSNIYTFDCKNPLGILAAEGLNGSINSQIGRERTKDIGVYSQATYSLTDQLKLTGGIRYTWDNETDQAQLITYNLPSPFAPAGTPPTPSCTIISTSGLPLCNASAKESSRAPTWLLDLDYTPADGTLIYAKYARGYRAGGITVSLPPPFSTFQPERLNTYEAGVKQSFLGALHGLLNIDGFYNDFGNQQIQAGFDPKPGANVAPAAGPINVGKSQIYGAEVDASFTPFRGFTVDADYTYLRTNIEAISAFSAPASSPYILVTQAAAGDRLVLSPTNKFTLSGSYVLPLDPDWGKMTFGASFIYSDPELSNYVDALAEEAPGVPNNQIRALSPLQARRLLNLSFNWGSIMKSSFDLNVFATNVTNDHYYTFASGLYSSSLGFETVQEGEPCFYGARVRYHFSRPPATPPAPPEAASAPVPMVIPARTYLVFFDWDRADLTSRAREIVASAATASTHVQTTRIEVNGYTDASGTAAYNQKLSVRRAQAVQIELVRDGVPPGEVSIQGFGERHPLVPTAAGVREPQNRRVEIILM